MTTDHNTNLYGFSNGRQLGNEAMTDGDQALHKGNPSQALQSYVKAYHHYLGMTAFVPDDAEPLLLVTRLLMDNASRAAMGVLHEHIETKGGAIELCAPPSEAGGR